ncbi:membrane protein insertase YidC [Spiroplasma endosymbiont of Crioceris asparagi]|uniref:membrane protein insertase YidC n=1 Tax=Spiroplasma endosymbiont of Crioceris asparagi TaxID=3066286 RepID=UPI0030CF1F8A
MYKNNQQNYLKFFENENNNSNKKTWKSRVKFYWTITKVVVFVFLMFTTLWGCVQMTQSGFMNGKVNDMAGNQFYSAGIGFEIVLKFLNDSSGKLHWIFSENGVTKEYDYNCIQTWGEAFSKTNGSPFYGLFVYPMSIIIVGMLRLIAGPGSNGVMDITSSAYGLGAFFALFMSAILIRSLTLAFSFKSQMNQGKIQELSIKSAAINEKYKDQTSQAAKMKKQQEIMALYKKEGVNQFSMIISMLISMPFLIAILSTIRATHALKVATFGSISFIDTPWGEIKNGHLQYLAIVVVYLLLQTVSMFLPQFLEKFLSKKTKVLTEEQKKAKRKQLIIQIVMVVTFVIFVNVIATGVAIYWIFSALYQITQTIAFFVYRENAKNIQKRKNAKRINKLKSKSQNI